MPCHNCDCASCAMERAKHGWIRDRLYQHGVNVAEVIGLVRPGFPTVYTWGTRMRIWYSDTRYDTKESAMQAAEVATLPANPTPDPAP